MWICLPNAFLSIVDYQPTRGDKTGFRLVRARMRGHIEAYFPAYKDQVELDTGTDYRFRAVVPADVVASVLACAALDMDYDNFKDEANSELYKFYFYIWKQGHQLQEVQRNEEELDAMTDEELADRGERDLGEELDVDVMNRRARETYTSLTEDLDGGMIICPDTGQLLTFCPDEEPQPGDAFEPAFGPGRIKRTRIKMDGAVGLPALPCALCETEHPDPWCPGCRGTGKMEVE